MPAPSPLPHFSETTSIKVSVRAEWPDLVERDKRLFVRMAAVFGQFFYIRDDFFYTMEKSWRSRRTRVRARTLRLASRSNDRILRPHWHDRCGHRSCAPHESAPGGGRDTRSQRARNLRQTISVSSTVFSTDTTERVACFSRGQSSTWMVRTSPTLGPLIYHGEGTARVGVTTKEIPRRGGGKRSEV